eukprot:Amastigsp_a841808_214.p1 type:complete len:238 gc:universal Amastigsp_a841808_214:1-714(+)
MGTSSLVMALWQFAVSAVLVFVTLFCLIFAASSTLWLVVDVTQNPDATSTTVTGSDMELGTSSSVSPSGGYVTTTVHFGLLSYTVSFSGTGSSAYCTLMAQVNPNLTCHKKHACSHFPTQSKGRAALMDMCAGGKTAFAFIILAVLLMVAAGATVALPMPPRIFPPAIALGAVFLCFLAWTVYLGQAKAIVRYFKHEGGHTNYNAGFGFSITAMLMAATVVGWTGWLFFSGAGYRQL